MDSRASAKRDLVTSAVLAGITVVYLIQGLRLPASGATRTDIGPAAYPLLVGSFLALATVVLASQATVRLVRARNGHGVTRSQSGRRLPERFWVFAGMVAATAGYLWALAPLGFLIATAAYIALELLIVGGVRGYRRGRLAVVAVLFGCVGSVAIYVVFAGLLGVLLPAGLLAPVFA